MELNRCSYTILGILQSRKAIDMIHGLTILEICSFEKVSKPNTIHKQVKNMQIKGYVSEGVKAGKGKTYYITENGQNILPKKKEED